MAFANATFNYHPSQVVDSAVPESSKQPGFASEHSPTMLANQHGAGMTNLDMHSSGPFRKDSLPVSANTGVLSPVDSLHHQSWDQQYTVGLQTDSIPANPANPFHNGRTFIAPSPAQRAYVQQQHPHQQWSTDQPTPMSTYASEYIQPTPHFDGVQFVAQPMSTTHSGYAPAPAHFHAQQPQHIDTTGFAPGPSHIPSPLSPQQQAPLPIDHMALASQTAEALRDRRLRSATPQRFFLDRQGDGVRKKNGRIEIPAGRNINNIDELIEQTTDEVLIKELKTQKRLLRNREAALLSRQRKKQHTENLEHKQRDHETQLESYHTALKELEETKQELEQANHLIQLLGQEKTDLTMAHNEESANLRRRLQYMEEQLEAGTTAPSMSTVPSSIGFADLNAGVEAMHFDHSRHHDTQPWDSFTYSQMAEGAHELFGFEAPNHDSFDHAQQQVVEKKASSTTLVPSSATQKKSDETAADPPIASSLVFMLLLFGAFMASQPAGSTIAAGLPSMPSAVQEVAPKVLRSLLESDVASAVIHDATNSNGEPAPSVVALKNIAPASRMDQVYRGVVAPTRQQDIDQTFALQTAQYAAITSTDYADGGGGMDVDAVGGSGSRPRRNLAEALNALESKHPRNSKADIYTRSLLWDRIPADVVQQFKQLVRERNENDLRRRSLETPGGIQGLNDDHFKVEV